MSEMIDLFEFEDEAELPVGSIIRLYGVKRFDVMRKFEDQLCEQLKKSDFFDYLLVDTNAFKNDTFLLINVTLNSNKRGEVLCVLRKDMGNSFLAAKVLKRFFAGNESVYIMSKSLDEH